MCDRERQREIHLRELAHAVMEARKSKIYRIGWKLGDTGEVGCYSLSSKADYTQNSPFFRGHESFSIKGLQLVNEGFPGGSDGKESACNAGDLGSTLELGRSPGGGIFSSILAWRIPIDREAWRVTKSQTQLSTALVDEAHSQYGA